MSGEDIRRYRRDADLLKALAHPARLCILHGLLREDACRVGRIRECLGLPQSTVSQHLAVLRAHGIVDGERQGTAVCYRVADRRVRRLAEALWGGEDAAEGKAPPPAK
ncbi:MAG: metalloregulator ArsR/SmtB family transcription factor [Thermoanaerobacterales bacterium]|nr:metalloregulator ArsR/SmtB family transcription factor [Bacillota bacterium]MDI6905902.1 metalloregulator ArsR/SmtB family transcription factor [Thermoanaerobacterales bacterium]